MIKNGFSLTTSQPQYLCGFAQKVVREARKKHNFPRAFFKSPIMLLRFFILGKSLIFSDHLTTFRLAPNDSKALEVVRELFLSDHPLTTAQIKDYE